MLPQEIEAKYELLGTLGSGAMGTVFDARDRKIRRRVAVKVLRRQAADDPEGAEADERFRREAEAAGRLSHPNIVAVHDYGENDSTAWIVMELVEGGSLKARLDRQERFALPEVVRLMDQILAALAYSHGRDVVHRDIKPANIMLAADGTVKLADFGIARLIDSSMTQVGTVMGTPSYMAPEQFLGEAVDARADLWAAGVVLYQLLTGEKPFDGGFAAVRHRVMTADPLPPSQLSVTTPRAFDAVIGRALAKRPEDRFPNAAAFAEAIRAAASGEATVAPHAAPADAEATMVAALGATLPPTPPAAAARPAAAVPSPPQARRRPPYALIAGAGGALVAGAVGAWLVLAPSDPPPAPPSAPAPLVLVPAGPGAASGTPDQPPPATATSPAEDARQQAAQRAAEETARQQAAQRAAEETARQQAAQRAAEEAARQQATQRAAEEAARQQAAQRAAEEAARQQATQRAAEEAARQQAAQRAAEEAARQQAAQRAAEETARQQAAQRNAEFRSAAAAAATAEPCSLLGWTVSDALITLGGPIRRGQEGAVLQALRTRGVPEAAIRLRLEPFDGPYCSVLEAIRPIAAEPEAAPRVDILGTQPLEKGDLLRLAVAMPDFPAQLHLAYLMKSGEVAQLIPSRAEAASAALRLGDKRPGFPGWEVDEPFGSDLILVVASERPIFPQRRPVVEKIEDYAAALTAQLQAMRGQGMRASARILVVETVARR